MAPRRSSIAASSTSARRTAGFTITSESKATNTSRPVSATRLQSESSTFAPCSLRPTKPQTPRSERQQSPRTLAASAFFTPSVIQSSSLGLSSRWRVAGATSSRRGAPSGVSYLSGFPFSFRRGSSGRIWCSTTSPSTPIVGITSAGTSAAWAGENAWGCSAASSSGRVAVK